MPAVSPADRLRSVAIPLLLAVLVASAGCSEALQPGGGDDAVTPSTDVVPGDVDAVAYVEVQSALADESLRQVANAYLEANVDSGPASVEDVLAEAENSSELSVDGLEAVTSFTRYAESGQYGGGATATDYGAAVVDASWNESAVVGAVENGSTVTLEESSYAGYTLYESDSDTIGVLDDGRFVVGSGEAVRDALDVAAGDASAVSGDLLAAFEDTRDGYVRYASAIEGDRVPTDQLDETEAIANADVFGSVSMVAGAVYVDGDTVGTSTSMTVPDADTAKDLRDVLRGAVAWARTSINGTPAGERYGGLIDRDSVSVEQSGSDVTVVLENQASELEAVVQPESTSS